MFTKQEIKDLILALIVLSFAITFVIFKKGGTTFIDALSLGFFVTLVAFMSHEIIGHKFLAQWYGFDADFKAWNLGLVLGIVTGLLALVSPITLVFAAPGAVYIHPYARKKFAFHVAHISKKQYGIISLGGPAVNIVIGFLFLFLSFYYSFSFLASAAAFSFFLAIFNLLPVSPLDGSKVFDWNRYIWVLSMGLAFAGYFIIPSILSS